MKGNKKEGEELRKKRKRREMEIQSQRKMKK